MIVAGKRFLTFLTPLNFSDTIEFFALKYGRPVGSEDYIDWTIEAMGFDSTHRPRGRPWKGVRSETVEKAVQLV